MIQLRINGTPLVLSAGARADLELVNARLSGLEDSFTLPLEIPVEGNEVLLEFAEQLALRDRTLEFAEAELWDRGQRRHVGRLFILASSPQVHRTSFSVDGFVAQLKGDQLRDIDMGPPINVLDTEPDLITYAANRNWQTWPTSPVCFPMVHNPDLYGSANRQWYPSASPWDATRAYAVNDLVEFEEGTTIRRTWRYQCIVATTAGQSPATTPTKWRLTAYGIVNHWDHTTSQFQVNDTDNVYAMVPYLYLKHVVERLAGTYGLQPEGAWWEDERYHQVILHNATSLDEQNDKAFYFYATQTSPASYPAGVQPFLPADDDTTPPREDFSGLWDTSAFTWTCPSPGTYLFRVRIKTTFGSADRLSCQLHVAGGGPWDVSLRQFAPGSAKTDWDHTFQFLITFGVGEVGTAFQFSSDAWNLSLFNPQELSDCWIQSWEIGASTVNTYADLIELERHLPDMTVEEFLMDLRDTFNLLVSPDRERGRLRLDYNEAALAQTTKPFPDWSRKRTGPIEIDHANSTTGVRLGWSLESDHGDLPDLTALYPAGIFDTEADLPGAVALKQYAVVRSTGLLYQSKAASDYLPYWYPIASYLPDVELGDQDDPLEVRPKWAPVAMTVVSVKDELFLVPHIPDTGTSSFFAVDRAPKLRLAFYHGMCVNESTAAEYPFASPYHMGPNGGTVHTTELDFNGDLGLHKLHWTKWAQLLINGEKVITDLQLDAEDILGRTYQDPVVIEHQLMVPMRLPITYGEPADHLHARGAELIRLKR